MGGSKFIPIVVAGLIGLFLGWLLGPDVGDVEEQMSSVQSSMAEQQDAIAQQVGALQTQIQALNEQVAGQADSAGKTVNDAVGGIWSDLQTSIEELRNASSQATSSAQEQISQVASDVSNRLQSIEQTVGQLGERLDQAGSGSSAGDQGNGQGGGDLAGRVGPNGAILLPEQAALFGNTRVDLVSVSGDQATISVGGQEQTVSSGDSVDLSGDCSVSLAGVSGGAAFLSATGCSAGGSDASASGGSSGGGDAGRLASQIGPTGAILLPEQAAIFAGTQVNLVSIDESAGTASVAVGGTDQSTVSAGDSIDIAENCSLTLAGVASGAAYFSSEGCGNAPSSGQGQGEAASNQSSGSGGASSSDNQSASNQAASGSNGSSSGGTSAGGDSYGVGQTASIGDARIFVSGVSDSGATLYSADGGRERVEVGSTYDAGNGCTVTVQAVENGRVQLSECGAGGESSSNANQGASSASSSGSQQSSGSGSDGSGQQASGSSASGGGESYGIGETATFGDARVFVSAVSDSGATLFPAGGSDRQTVEVGSSMDIGNGCTVTVDGVEGSRVQLSGGCGDQASSSGNQGNGQSSQSGTANQPANANSASSENASQQSNSDGEQSADSSEPSSNSGGNDASGSSGGQQASSGSGEGYATGQTATFGDQRVFVSAISGSGATLYVPGAGREQVEAGSSIDAGNGCSITLDGVSNGRAQISASGC
ncbi:MAG: apolipoprotein A1/A4/E family protein [Fulvimarina manganoxydans]|uniref:hypothetical protein n=1 Tax=Fulvimarina manganoxydans TaxID=937218 RepID=UPI0023557534|nr:hypothetical protein [Fulvimarina manganoxydans]MCK5932479.1 apolipoprotein A1/A4/E family protein [Fulvimarina manganoxydans]